MRVDYDKDQLAYALANALKERDEWAAMCGRYKQERDMAQEKLDEEMKWHHRTHTELVQTQCKILDMQMGRDEVQEKYDNLATEHMLAVNKLCEERDDARDALSRIDEIFCDGEDTHDDWMIMGNIAKNYFKGLE